jgi:hypothetical protein
MGMDENLTPVIVGGLLATLGGIAGQVFLGWQTTRQSRRGIAGAFAGEISAVCTSVRHRDYLKGLTALLQQVRATSQPDWFRVRITQDYFVVFTSNTDKLGLLPSELAEGVAIFYTLCKSFIEDMAPESFEPRTFQEAERLLSEQVSMLENILERGDWLVAGLRKLSR